MRSWHVLPTATPSLFTSPTTAKRIYDYRDFFCRSHDLPLTPEVCKYQFEIPFMIWMSDTYRRNRPDVAAQVAGALDRPFSADDLSHLLLDLRVSDADGTTRRAA